MNAHPKLFVYVVLFVLVAGLTTPVAAQDPQEFCKGNAALIFSPETPLPSTAPCDGSTVTRYTLIEPWRAGCEGSASDPDCNVGFKMSDTWDRILTWLETNGFDRGSVWAENKTYDGASAPAATDNGPAADQTFWSRVVGSLWCPGALLLAAALLLLAFALSRRKPASKPSTPAPPATK